jgi:hypothetical protein
MSRMAVEYRKMLDEFRAMVRAEVHAENAARGLVMERDRIRAEGIAAAQHNAVAHKQAQIEAVLNGLRDLADLAPRMAPEVKP